MLQHDENAGGRRGRDAGQFARRLAAHRAAAAARRAGSARGNEETDHRPQATEEKPAGRRDRRPSELQDELAGKSAENLDERWNGPGNSSISCAAGSRSRIGSSRCGGSRRSSNRNTRTSLDTQLRACPHPVRDRLHVCVWLRADADRPVRLENHAHDRRDQLGRRLPGRDLYRPVVRPGRSSWNGPARTNWTTATAAARRWNARSRIVAASATSWTVSLPNGSGNFSSRLAAAEKEQKELEAMAPLHQRARRCAQTQPGVSPPHHRASTEELREARSRWRRGLRQAGLPDILTPKHVRQLGSHHQKKAKIEEQIVRRRERLAKLEDEPQLRSWSGCRSCIRTWAFTRSARIPQVQFSQLAAALAGQREMVQRRRDLQKEERELRRQLATDLQEIRRLRRSRESLFAEARVTDEDELRTRVEQLNELRICDKRQPSLSEQITAILGGHCTDADIERELDDYNAENLQASLGRSGHSSARFARRTSASCISGGARSTRR